MGTENLWEDLFTSNEINTTDSFISIIDSYARDLESASSNKVHARFTRIKNTESSPLLISQEYAQTLKSALQNTKAEKEQLSQKDANSLYDTNKYAFDIYGDEYKFRVFTADVGPVYPVRVEPDINICYEVGVDLERFLDFYTETPNYWINDDESVHSFFKVIIKSRKMQFMVKRLSGD